MTGNALIVAGIAVLAFAWGGPLPGLVPASFAAHMILHMTVVGLGAPLLAIGLVMRFGSGAFAGIPVALAAVLTILDLAVVWGWHAPALHHASRTDGWMLALEQAMFALVTLALWVTAFAGPALAGALALFMTSMHMTLLGALLALSPRTVYPDHHPLLHPFGLGPLDDQQLGGAVMLGVGGSVYLIAGLFLVARLLRRPVAP